MHKLIHKIVRKIHSEQLLTAGDTVVTAVSGGTDSTALLHILANSGLNLQLIAVYIDHGLRPSEAEIESVFTRQLAESLGHTHLSSTVNVLQLQRKTGCSPEEAARLLRYRELERIRVENNAQVIAVGHTADDQVEEFFIRLIRGTGLKGLSGMTYRRDHIIRPLLGETRSTLVKYLQEHNLDHCHDSSNDDRGFLRNRVRLDLIPELENHYNPSIRTTILQTATIFSEEEDLLDSMAEDFFTSLCSMKPKDTTSVPEIMCCKRVPFTEIHPAIQRRIIEKICWKMQSKPSFRQIVQLQQLICTGIAGARLHLPLGLRTTIDADQVIFSYPQGRQRVRGEGPAQTASYERKIESTGVYLFPELHAQLTIETARCSKPNALPNHTLAIDSDKISFPLVVRPPKPGETMHPLGAPGRKKITRILSDMKIPVRRRRLYPVVVAENEPVALIGLRIVERVKITATTSAILLLRWEIEVDNEKR